MDPRSQQLYFNPLLERQTQQLREYVQYLRERGGKPPEYTLNISIDDMIYNYLIDEALFEEYLDLYYLKTIPDSPASPIHQGEIKQIQQLDAESAPSQQPQEAIYHLRAAKIRLYGVKLTAKREQFNLHFADLVNIVSSELYIDYFGLTYAPEFYQAVTAGEQQKIEKAIFTCITRDCMAEDILNFNGLLAKSSNLAEFIKKLSARDNQSLSWQTLVRSFQQAPSSLEGLIYELNQQAHAYYKPGHRQQCIGKANNILKQIAQSHIPPLKQAPTKGLWQFISKGIQQLSTWIYNKISRLPVIATALATTPYSKTPITNDLYQLLFRWRLGDKSMAKQNTARQLEIILSHHANRNRHDIERRLSFNTRMNYYLFALAQSKNPNVRFDYQTQLELAKSIPFSKYPSEAPIDYWRTEILRAIDWPLIAKELSLEEFNELLDTADQSNLLKDKLVANDFASHLVENPNYLADGFQELRKRYEIMRLKHPQAKPEVHEQLAIALKFSENEVIEYVDWQSVVQQITYSELVLLLKACASHPSLIQKMRATPEFAAKCVELLNSNRPITLVESLRKLAILTNTNLLNELNIDKTALLDCTKATAKAALRDQLSTCQDLVQFIEAVRNKPAIKDAIKLLEESIKFKTLFKTILFRDRTTSANDKVELLADANVQTLEALGIEAEKIQRHKKLLEVIQLTRTPVPQEPVVASSASQLATQRVFKSVSTRQRGEASSAEVNTDLQPSMS